MELKAIPKLCPVCGGQMTYVIKWHNAFNAYVCNDPDCGVVIPSKTP